jgi:hypothetical protein
LGGACGQLRCRAESWKHYPNPIIAAQYFEYKVSFQLKGALDSTTGYLSIFNSVLKLNRYLAEDIVVCFDLVLKPAQSGTPRTSTEPLQRPTYLQTQSIG